jgi:hypothetical protein
VFILTSCCSPTQLPRCFPWNETCLHHPSLLVRTSRPATQAHMQAGTVLVHAHAPQIFYCSCFCSRARSLHHEPAKRLRMATASCLLLNVCVARECALNLLQGPHGCPNICPQVRAFEPTKGANEQELEVRVIVHEDGHHSHVRREPGQQANSNGTPTELHAHPP